MAHPQTSLPNPSAGNRHTDLHHQNPSPPSLHSPPRQAGSRRSCEAEVLAHLGDIEVEVDALNREALDHLNHLGQPSSSGLPTPFPHGDLLPLSKELKSQLETITFKGPAVLELKNSILKKLQTIELKVMTARKVWNEELANIKAAKTPRYGLPCETGNLSPKHFLSNFY